PRAILEIPARQHDPHPAPKLAGHGTSALESAPSCYQARRAPAWTTRPPCATLSRPAPSERYRSWTTDPDELLGRCLRRRDRRQSTAVAARDRIARISRAVAPGASSCATAWWWTRPARAPPSPDFPPPAPARAGWPRARRRSPAGRASSLLR